MRALYNKLLNGERYGRSDENYGFGTMRARSKKITRARSARVIFNKYIPEDVVEGHSHLTQND